ncbi:MAG: carbon starvation protein A [Opitutales bacterium]|nr:carbon starvation protein A [Opitutales bacterium]
MKVLLIAVVAALAYILAYRTYGRWLGAKLFQLSASRVCPSVYKSDGRDFVPTSREVLFGHHFASIAGTGPIVGPAIAVLWGWVPALLWIVFGSIFIGAVHDMGALVISIRNDGRTVGDIAGRLINKRARILFLAMVFLALAIFLAVLGLVMASVFRMFPRAIFPCLVQIPLAIGIGCWLHRSGRRIFPASVLALVLMYLSVMFGDWGPLHEFNTMLSLWPVWAWVLVLLAYSYVASVLPVWVLLQPRDYINSLQLITLCVLLVLGLIFAVSGNRELVMLAPAFNLHPAGAPPFLPFLFITVACGAVSGFHNIVSSGSTSKQLSAEPDTLPIGYGGMLSEGFLAVIVLLACGAGIGLGMAGKDGVMLYGGAAWEATYSSWGSMSGLGPCVSAFVHGSGNFLGALGFADSYSVALMGLFVASFAGTSMDTACRLQRYVVEELSHAMFGSSTEPLDESLPKRKPAWSMIGRFLESRHGATLFAVLTAGALAMVPAPGKDWGWDSVGTGGLILWPLFGVTNQLVVGLAFLVLVAYLLERGKPVWMVILPCALMLILPLWAIVWQVFIGGSGGKPWIDGSNIPLAVIGVLVIFLECWIIAESWLVIRRMFGKNGKVTRP